MERLDVDGKVYHKMGCFKCDNCKCTLSAGNYAGLDGKYFCKPHFKQLFKLKGNYNEGFGSPDPKRKWANQAPINGFQGVDKINHDSNNVPVPSIPVTNQPQQVPVPSTVQPQQVPVPSTVQPQHVLVPITVGDPISYEQPAAEAKTATSFLHITEEPTSITEQVEPIVEHLSLNEQPISEDTNNPEAIVAPVVEEVVITLDHH